jgi:manganese/zinc/iron transport system substrate-binding protein
MNGRMPLVVLAAIIIIAGIAVPRLLGDSAASIDDGTLHVTTTTGMVGDLVANIGGEYVTVTALMGPGVDPHLYKPSAGDVERLSDADVIFYNGLHLEGRMVDIFESLAQGGKPTYPVAELIPEDRLRKPVEFEGNYDPHIWFDVTLWKYAAQAVADHLAAEDPDHAEAFMTNRDSYLARLDQLDRYIREQVATIPETSRVLVTAHDAFGYFGRQYGLEVFGLQGTSTASEASANDVQELAQLISGRQVKAIFVESSVPLATIEAVQAACKASGWDVSIGGQLFSDAMGKSGTPEGTYIGMVRHNIDAIVRALR